MVVEKRGNKFCTVHCHGADAGKVIACFDTKEEAMAQHRAIEASKHAEKIEINLTKLERGLRREKVPVHRKSGITYEYRRVGRKEEKEGSPGKAPKGGYYDPEASENKPKKEESIPSITLDKLNDYIKNSDPVKSTAISNCIADTFGYTYKTGPSTYLDDRYNLLTLLIDDEYPGLSEGDIMLSAIEVEKRGDGHRIVAALKDALKKLGYNNIVLEAFPKHEDEDTPVTGSDILNLVDWWKRQGFEVEYEEDLKEIDPEKEYWYQDSMFGSNNAIDMFCDLTKLK